MVHYADLFSSAMNLKPLYMFREELVQPLLTFMAVIAYFDFLLRSWTA